MWNTSIQDGAIGPGQHHVRVSEPHRPIVLEKLSYRQLHRRQLGTPFRTAVSFVSRLIADRIHGRLVPSSCQGPRFAFAQSRSKPRNPDT